MPSPSSELILRVMQSFSALIKSFLYSPLSNTLICSTALKNFFLSSSKRILKVLGITLSMEGKLPMMSLDKIVTLSTAKATILLSIVILTSESLAVFTASTLLRIRAGIMILQASFASCSSIFRAAMCESVAPVMTFFPSIMRLIPLKIGLLGSSAVANAVFLIIFSKASRLNIRVLSTLSSGNGIKPVFPIMWSLAWLPL